MANLPSTHMQSVEEDIKASELYLWTNERFKEALKECSMCSEGDGVHLVSVSTLFGPKFLYNE
jgi:hypothetical protein